MPLLLTRQDVQSILTMRMAVETVQQAFQLLADGQATMSPHTTISVPEHNGSHLSMAAYIGGQVGALGSKIVTIYPDNPQKQNLPSDIGILLLNDLASGAPLSIMDASFLTAMCTGATSGVATRYLARRSVNDVVVFGSGTRARTQLMAMCVVRSIDGAMVLDPDSKASARFADEMSKALNIPIQPAQDVQAAVEIADVIITASHAQEPLFKGEWLHPGVHVNAVGSCIPKARELDSETIRRAKLVLDRRASLRQTGDLCIPLAEGEINEDHIYAELGEVVAENKPGRQSDDEITVFKSVGLAIQDIAVAAQVYQQALKQGVGQMVTL